MLIINDFGQTVKYKVESSGGGGPAVKEGSIAFPGEDAFQLPNGLYSVSLSNNPAGLWAGDQLTQDATINLSTEKSFPPNYAANARDRINKLRGMIGKPCPAAINEYLLEEHNSQNEALQKAQQRLLEPRPLDNYYGGSASVVFGVVYGELTVSLTFGDGNRWQFFSKIWGGGVGTAIGVGTGPWAPSFNAPYQGQEMNFQISSAQLTAGEIQVFWWIKAGDPLVGAAVFLAGGLGVFGGGGTGVWTKL